MKTLRVLGAAVAVVAALAFSAVPAHADGVPPQSFYADSTSPLDTCPHGITKGTLTWHLPGPLAATAVDVAGSVVDRPTISTGPVDCANDGYSSTAIFTAYNGSVVVGSKRVTVDNATANFAFTIGIANSTTSRITHLVVQVCRNPVVTLPPSYCGRAVTYRS